MYSHLQEARKGKREKKRKLLLSSKQHLKFKLTFSAGKAGKIHNKLPFLMKWKNMNSNQCIFSKS